MYFLTKPKVIWMSGFLISFLTCFAYFLPFGIPPLFTFIISVYSLYLLEKKSIYSFYKIIPFFILFCYFLFSLIWENNIIDLVFALTPYVNGILCFWLVQAVVKKNQQNCFFNGFLLAGYLCIIVSVLHFFVAHLLNFDFLVEYKRQSSLAQYHRSRMMGTAGNPNQIAFWMYVFCLISIQKNKSIRVFKSGIFFLGILLANSRGVIVATLIALFQNFKKRLLTNSFAVCIIFVMLFCLIVFFKQAEPDSRLHSMFMRIAGFEEISSLLLRFEIWSDVYKKFTLRPYGLIFGYGLANNEFIITENSYIKILSQFGIFGFILIFIFLFANKKNIYKNSFYFLSLIIACSVNEFIDNRLFYILLGFLCAKKSII